MSLRQAHAEDGEAPHPHGSSPALYLGFSAATFTASVRRFTIFKSASPLFYVLRDLPLRQPHCAPAHQWRAGSRFPLPLRKRLRRRRAQACNGSVENADVGQGGFVVQIRQDGACNLREGQARFNPASKSTFVERPAFWAQLGLSAESGPHLYFVKSGSGAEEQSYDVADLSKSLRGVVEPVGEKMGFGGQRVSGHQALSRSGTVTIETAGQETVAGSFDVTLAPEGDAEAPIQVRGRFEATKDEDLPWTTF